MRGTVAKRLRKQAEAQSVGLPEIKYTGVKGKTRVLHPACERAVYKALKKRYRHG